MLIELEPDERNVAEALARCVRAGRRMRSSARAAVSAHGREVGVAPEMLVAHAEQGARDRSLASQPDEPRGAA